MTNLRLKQGFLLVRNNPFLDEQYPICASLCDLWVDPYLCSFSIFQDQYPTLVLYSTEFPPTRYFLPLVVPRRKPSSFNSNHFHQEFCPSHHSSFGFKLSPTQWQIPWTSRLPLGLTILTQFLEL